MFTLSRVGNSSQDIVPKAGAASVYSSPAIARQSWNVQKLTQIYPSFRRYVAVSPRRAPVLAEFWVTLGYIKSCVKRARTPPPARLPYARQVLWHQDWRRRPSLCGVQRSAGPHRPLPKITGDQYLVVHDRSPAEEVRRVTDQGGYGGLRGSNGSW